MQIDQQKLEYFLKELKKRGKEISGGNVDKLRASYVLRDPNFYWDFGKFLVEQAQQLDEEKRDRWILRQTKNIERDILGEVSNDDWLVPKIYTWVNELQDKEHFMYVVDLAGHKFSSFRIKVLEYIYDIFSKKNPSHFSDTKKDELAKKLSEKKLTHTEINEILKEFRGKSKSSLGHGIKDSFTKFSSRVEDVVKDGNSSDRESLKNEIGKNMIDKLRTYLQILPLTGSLFDEMISEYKSLLNRKISTKNENAKKLDEAFGKCIKDKDLKIRILKMINAYEMGETNTFLNAIESEGKYEEWKRTKENFEQMAID